MAMLEIFKKLFSKPQEPEPAEDKPGRTFNKILTSKYFGLEDNRADKTLIAELKEKKISQINDLQLAPKFARYLYSKDVEDYTKEEPIGVQLSFQKETHRKKRNMIHVSEMSFVVKSEDFDEFEQKLEVSLLNDFKHLAPENTFKGTERRKQTRVA